MVSQTGPRVDLDGIGTMTQVEVQVNRYGLQRRIPAAVKRAVRQGCGFGCAICGSALVQYHHFDPPFEAARKHRPEGMVLLCPTCHTRFQHIPAQEMRHFRLNPRCKQTGFLSDANFLFRMDHIPRVTLGHVIATSGQIIRHGDRVLLGIERPDRVGAPLSLVCDLRDGRNITLLRIRQNELVVGADHYDVETSRRELVIRRKQRHVVLRMVTDRLDKLEMTHLEAAVAGGAVSSRPEQGLCVTAPGGGRIAVKVNADGEIGVWIRDDGECWIGGGPHTSPGAVQNWV